jgi:hypothetical protein
MNIEGKRERGRPKKRWLDTIENDMKAVSVWVGNVENRDEWRFGQEWPIPTSWKKGEKEEK